MTFSKPATSFLGAVATALIVSTPAVTHAQVLERLPNIYPLTACRIPTPVRSG